MREPDANSWLPIETAPKDGTPIIASYYPWNNRASEMQTHVVWFLDGEWRTYPCTNDKAYVEEWVPMPTARKPPVSP